MANDVKWIKINPNFLDGTSFKYMRRAKVDGVTDFRDKLEAIWFELLGLAGQVNNKGFFQNDEIAYVSFDDIAIMLDRTTKEIEICMEFYLKQKMIEIIDNCYCLSNWEKYQNNDGLEKIRLQNAERQKIYRERQKLSITTSENNSNVTDNVTHNVTSRNSSISYSISNNMEDNKGVIGEKEKPKKRFVKPTLEEVETYCQERNNGIDAQTFIDFYESKGWVVGKSPMKDWKSAINTWERNDKSWGKPKDEKPKYYSDPRIDGELI